MGRFIDSITLVDVNLRNQSAMDMKFQWPFVGAITVHIPAGELRITKHSFPASVVLENQAVSFNQCHFKVNGDAQVIGSGLILSKIVGKRTVDLTIRKTDSVLMKGSLYRSARSTTFYIPSAVLRDSFNLLGSVLGMSFKGNIYAKKSH